MLVLKCHPFRGVDPPTLDIFTEGIAIGAKEVADHPSEEGLKRCDTKPTRGLVAVAEVTPPKMKHPFNTGSDHDPIPAGIALKKAKESAFSLLPLDEWALSAGHA